MADIRHTQAQARHSWSERLRAAGQIIAGAGMLIAGSVLLSTATGGEASGGEYIQALAPMFAGIVLLLRGAWQIDLIPSFGYKSYVAWRYLLVAHPKVTTRTKVAIAILSVLRGMFYLVPFSPLQYAPGADHSYLVQVLNDPVQLGALATNLLFTVVVFWGVLRYSKPSMFMFLFGIALLVISGLGVYLIGHHQLPFLKLDAERSTQVLQVLGIVEIVGGFLAGLATFFGSLRAFFTFFTTVPIGGVWIGTSALVCVLAVMSGFETDLREKILGSNAHIQITREDGDFVEWRAAKTKVDQVPGVVASTPYAVSEVVIAAHNNGMNVIIKGIDPKTVGKVTDLVSDLEDREAMQRLDPIVDDSHDRIVPQKSRPSGPVMDPPPADMPSSGDPIDFSAHDEPTGSGSVASGSGSAASGSGSAASGSGSAASGSGSAASGSGSAASGSGSAASGSGSAASGSGSAASGSGSAASGSRSATSRSASGGSDADLYLEPPPDSFGDDARRIVHGHGKIIDPPPPDLLSSDEPPTDYSRDGDSAIHVIDIPTEPTLSRRTQGLPGVLVGRELVKQTHLYTGEEVRVVSPLSDPSNPDATGTPIPFNRDYRVAGIFYTGMYEYDLKYVYVSLDSLQDFLDRGDTVDGIEVRIEDPDDTEAFVTKLHATLGPGYRIVDWHELNRSLFSALKLEKIAMFLVLGIVILVASFSIVGNLIMVVVEKAREIALLKTLGASDVGVMQLFAIQGLLIGVIGTALGVLTGLLGCWAGKRFGLPLNPDVYYIDRLPIHVDPQSVAAAAAAGILISIAATLYPALLAARVRPAAGMRH